MRVPKKLHDRLGIDSGAQVEFREQRGQSVLVEKEPCATITRIRGKIKRLPFGKNVDHYVKVTRGKP